MNYYYTTEEILLFLGNRIISERSWDYLKNLLFRRGKVTAYDILQVIEDKGESKYAN